MGRHTGNKGLNGKNINKWWVFQQTMLFSAEIRLASGVQDWKKRGMRSRIQTPPTIRLPPLILDTDSLYILVLGHWLTKSWRMVYRYLSLAFLLR